MKTVPWHEIFQDNYEEGRSVKDGKGRVLRYGTSLGVDFLKANQPELKVSVPLGRAGLVDASFLVLQG